MESLYEFPVLSSESPSPTPTTITPGNDNQPDGAMHNQTVIDGLNALVTASLERSSPATCEDIQVSNQGPVQPVDSSAASAVDDDTDSLEANHSPVPASELTQVNNSISTQGETKDASETCGLPYDAKNQDDIKVSSQTNITEKNTLEGKVSRSHGRDVADSSPVLYSTALTSSIPKKKHKMFSRSDAKIITRITHSTPV